MSNDALIKARSAIWLRKLWQPIATAPKSSDWILILCERGACDSASVGVGSREFITDGPVDGWHWSEVRFQCLQFVPPLGFDGKGSECTAAATPTHWMPFPTPADAGAAK